jgi:hypothetical protein
MSPFSCALETTTSRLRAGTPVILFASDLEAGRRFYFDLLGFVPAEGYGYSDSRLVLVSPLLAHGFRSIVLTRNGRTAASHGLILELETGAELLDRYMLARLLGAPTTPLLTRGRCLSVIITDPDGNSLELRAGHTPGREPSPAPAEVPTRGNNDRRWGRSSERDARPRAWHGGRAGLEGTVEPAGDASLAWFDSYCANRDGDAA